MLKFKDAMKNEYVKSLILLAIILSSIVAFWFGLKTYLRTDYPLLAVASGSMVPTLYRGDLIIVQGGLNVDDVVAEYETGDIIVFHKPSDPDELIVHRAVEKYGSGDTAFLRTKGDNNPGTDSWEVDNNYLVGKVVWVIPYLGQIPLFVRTPIGMSIIVILIVVLILLEFVMPSSKKKEMPEQSTKETEVLNIVSL